MRNIKSFQECQLHTSGMVEINSGSFMYWSEAARAEYGKAIVSEAAKVCMDTCRLAPICEPQIGHNGVKTEI